MTRTAIAILLLASAATALAQHQQPYAGIDQRPVKAFSEQQIADLKAGRGMGLALAAELNGYPGPMHVLEHATALGLTTAQRERTRALFDSMKAKAIPVGEQLIEQEARLDRLFSERQVTSTTLRAATEQIGATQARLRETHLNYHLAMMDVLKPEQIERYRSLRGYGRRDAPPHHHKER